MNRGRPAHPLPAAVLADVTRVVGVPVAAVDRLTGGSNGGAVRVLLDGRQPAVLKAAPRTHSDQFAQAQRANRVAAHMRERGYPTPAWLGVGATARHVWQLTELVDAAPAAALTPPLIEQLMGVIALQAGQASEPYDHWRYAWRVATGSPLAAGRGDDTPEQARLRRSIATLPGYSPEVAALVARLRALSARVPAPSRAPDMVHADLATPTNVLVRAGAVVAVVDIGNAGSGTRATDLTSLVWYTCTDPQLAEVRARLWTAMLDAVGPDQAAVLTAAHILHMLELPVRHRRPTLVAAVVDRGHRAIDELTALT